MRRRGTTTSRSGSTWIIRSGPCGKAPTHRSEAHPENELQRPAAGIVGVIEVAERRAGLAESRAHGAIDTAVGGGAAGAEDVWVVEDVQRRGAKLHVPPLLDVGPLDRAHVPFREPRTPDEDSVAQLARRIARPQVGSAGIERAGDVERCQRVLHERLRQVVNRPRYRTVRVDLAG